jgi:hypothetical protein
LGTKGAWTPKRRARQGQLIRETKPWEKSTGPTSAEGKAVSSRNAYKGDWHHEQNKRLDDTWRGILNVFGRERGPRGFGRLGR